MIGRKPNLWCADWNFAINFISTLSYLISKFSSHESIVGFVIERRWRLSLYTTKAIIIATCHILSDTMILDNRPPVYGELAKYTVELKQLP